MDDSTAYSRNVCVSLAQSLSNAAILQKKYAAKLFSALKEAFRIPHVYLVSLDKPMQVLYPYKVHINKPNQPEEFSEKRSQGINELMAYIHAYARVERKQLHRTASICIGKFYSF